MAPSHGNVGDVGRPNLIGLIDGHVLKQIGIDFVGRMEPTGFGLGIDRFKAHQPHEPLHSLAVDLVAQTAKMIAHAAAAATWPFYVLLVDQAHVFQVLGRGRPWLVIDRRAADVHQLALAWLEAIRRVTFWWAVPTLQLKLKP